MAFSFALDRFIARVRCHRYLPDLVKILSKRSRCDLIFLLPAEMMAQASILGNDNGPDRVFRKQSGPEAKNGRLFMKTLMQAAFAAGAFCMAASVAMADPAVVYDAGGKFDKSFNEAAYNGIEELKKETATR